MKRLLKILAIVAVIVLTLLGTIWVETQAAELMSQRNTFANFMGVILTIVTPLVGLLLIMWSISKTLSNNQQINDQYV